MDWSSSPKGNQTIITRITPLLDEMHTRSVRHVFIHHLVNTPSRTHPINAERASNLFFDGMFGLFHIEPHFSTQEIVGAEIPEHQIRIRHRRFVSPTVITHRTRFGASTIGTNF